MRIIVSDTSCIIDLRKAALLLEALRLPYTFVTVNTLFEDEWLALRDNEKKRLCEQGLDVRELPGSSVQRAAQYSRCGYFSKILSSSCQRTKQRRIRRLTQIA